MRLNDHKHQLPTSALPSVSEFFMLSPACCFGSCHCFSAQIFDFSTFVLLQGNFLDTSMALTIHHGRLTQRKFHASSRLIESVSALWDKVRGRL